MKIPFPAIFVLVVAVLAISSLPFFAAAATAYRQREFFLFNESDTSENYHRIVFNEVKGGANHSICLSASASTTQKDTIVNRLCQAVGFTGIFTSAYQSTTVDLDFPNKLTISSCDTTKTDLTNFEAQCTFTTASSCTPIAINCTGPRNGGEYGTFVPAANNPLYLRMTYDRLFQHRRPFEYEWWSQCDDYVYTGTTTNFLCTALDGFRRERTGTKASNAVESVDDFEWRNLYCPADAQSFDDCSYIESRSSIESLCSTSEGLAVYCSQHKEGNVDGGYRWRLYQTTADDVPIEVLSESTSPSVTYWGRVCDDRFSSYSANDEMMCRLAGFPGKQASWTSRSTYTTSSNEFLFDSIGCQNFYTSFSQCSRGTSPSCSSFEAVNVACPYINNYTIAAGPVNSGSNIYLRLTNKTRVVQVAFSSSDSATWYGICENSMSYQTASRIGKFLELGDRCSWKDVYLPRGTTFYYNYVKCDEADTNFAACSKSTSSCSSSSLSAVALPKCWNQATGLLLGSYALRISDDGKNRLEIRAAESVSWGQIYYSSYSSTTARNLCRMFGFDGGSYSMGRTSGGTGQVVMRNLYCSTYTKSDFQDMCSFTTTGLSDYSAGSSDMYLRCGTMDNSGSNNNDDDDDEDDNSALVGIIIGSVWGGIVFFVIVGAICASCCDSDEDCDCDCDCSDCCCDDSDCCDCDDCCDDCCDCGDDDVCCACCCASSSASASASAAEARRRREREDQERRDRLESERLQRERERNERREARRRNRVGFHDASSSSSEDDTIGDRRCPVCYKVLKTEDGRNNHMRDKHPGADIPAHGANTFHYSAGVPAAVPTVPPGYSYPPAPPTMHIHEQTNYSDNVAPPPGGYSFGIPMQPVMNPVNNNNDNNNMNNNNNPYPHSPFPPAPGNYDNNNSSFGGGGAPSQQDQNMAFGIPPPTFGPSPFIPGYAPPPQNGMYSTGYGDNNNNSATRNDSNNNNNPYPSS